MAVGFPVKANYATGDVLTATNMNDLSGSVNLLQSSQYGAGRNAIINGGFDVWQRGTSNVTTALVYTADRWQKGAGTHFGISRTTVSDTTNLPTIQYAGRVQRTAASAVTTAIDFGYSMESVDATKFVGQAAILSFYARKGANYSGAAGASFNFALYTGTGTDQSIMTGYTGSAATLNTSATLTTSMARYSATVTIPTTATEIGLYFNYTPTGTAGANDYVDITGVQLELGSNVTTFSRTGASIQGELAACQRYYWRTTASQFNPITPISSFATSSTAIAGQVVNPVTMRVAATSLDYTGGYFAQRITTSADKTVSSYTLGGSNPYESSFAATVASGASTGHAGYIAAANNNDYLGFSAEL
jgi:hypothetical protein